MSILIVGILCMIFGYLVGQHDGYEKGYKDCIMRENKLNDL